MAVSKNRKDARGTRSVPAEALTRELERYRRLLELAPVGYLVSDGEGAIHYASPPAADMLGRDTTDLVGASVAEIVAPERRPALKQLLGMAAGGGEWHDEVPFVDPDGGRVRLVVHAVGQSDPDDTTISWSLTEPAAPGFARSAGTDALAAQDLQRRRLSTLLDRLHHVVISFDHSLRIVYANSAAHALLGDEDLVGRTLPDPWAEPSLRTLSGRMFEHNAVPEETRVALEDGTAYDVVALPPDASGEALLVIGDVTAHDRRGRAEREFVANAAHQLRTPVAAIASAIEVLQGGAKEVPEARDRFLAHLDRQCTRLVRLTRALLILARAQALSEPPAVEIVLLRPLLDAVARALRPGEGVDVRVECPDDVAALTSRDLLEQAIENLAENAAKYTVSGEIVLCAERASKQQIRIVVRDTGPGAELAGEGSFKRFYRDPNAQGEGFGLGLAIASETIRALGGELRLDSTPDGTRADALLPAAEVRRW
jgi:two-component system phosphate regulon sensor histidine kinase PhoR